MKLMPMRQLVSRMQTLHYQYRQLERQFTDFLDGAKDAGNPKNGIEGVTVGEARRK